MANEQQGGRTPDTEEREREADAAERIERRRESEREMDRREEEGYGDPESSAQKLPPTGPRP
jgi:hypothetical protein